MTTSHQTVLLTEAVDALQIKPGHWYIDATFGGGGHTQQILDNGGNVIAFDFDHQAIELGKKKFKSYLEQNRLIFIEENFAKLSASLKTEKVDHPIDGALFDFGTSTDQLMNEQRGFSFTGDGELDMRMDERLGVKAKDLLAILSERQLGDLFLNLGGEREARKIARRINEERKKGRFISTTKELVDLVGKAKQFRSKLHPATKVFQALRIAVNDELDNISQALPQALKELEPGAKLVTISFHEGEDRIVKNMFKQWQSNNWGEAASNKVIMPSEKTIQENPRSRSAKMRIFEKNHEKK